MANEMFTNVVTALQNGELAILPTDTVYGLAGTDPAVINARKNSPLNKPLVLQVHSTTKALKLMEIHESHMPLLYHHWPGALTVVGRDASTPDKSLAIRVPKHLWLRTLLEQTGPLYITSANISGKPAAQKYKDIPQGVTDIRVDGDDMEDTNQYNTASTIVDLRGETPVVLRQGSIQI